MMDSIIQRLIFPLALVGLSNYVCAVDICAELDFAPNSLIRVRETDPAGDILFQISLSGTETWGFSLRRSLEMDEQAWRSLTTYFDFRKANDSYKMVLNKPLDIEDIYVKLGVKLKVLEMILSCTTGDTKQTQTRQLFVQVIPVNEFNPRFLEQGLGNDSIPEDTSIGNIVFKLKPYVVDDDLDPLRSELGPFKVWPYLPEPRLDGREFFQLADSQQGTFVVSKSLDFEELLIENMTTLYINVSASDVHQARNFTTLTFKVTDVNDLPPEFYHPNCPVEEVRSRPCFVSYEAQVPVGFQGEVTKMSPSGVQARDMDAMDKPILYFLRDALGETEGLQTKFNIDKNTGELTLLTPFNKPRVVKLIVEAREDTGSDNSRFTQAVLTITVLDNKVEEGPVLLVENTPADEDNSLPLYLIVTAVVGVLLLAVNVALCVVWWKLSENKRRRVAPLKPSLHNSLDDIKSTHSPLGSNHLVSTHSVVDESGHGKTSATKSNPDVSPIITRSMLQGEQLLVGLSETLSENDVRSKGMTYPPESHELTLNAGQVSGKKDRTGHLSSDAEECQNYNRRNSNAVSPLSTVISLSRDRARSLPVIPNATYIKYIQQSVIRNASSAPDVYMVDGSNLPTRPNNIRAEFLSKQKFNQRINNFFDENADGANSLQRVGNKDKLNVHTVEDKDNSSLASNTSSMTNVSEPESATSLERSLLFRMGKQDLTEIQSLPLVVAQPSITPAMSSERLPNLDENFIEGDREIKEYLSNQSQDADIDISPEYQSDQSDDLRTCSGPTIDRRGRKRTKRRKKRDRRSDKTKSHALDSGLEASSNDGKAKEDDRIWQASTRLQDIHENDFYRWTHTTNMESGEDLNDSLYRYINRPPFICESDRRDQFSIGHEYIDDSSFWVDVPSLKIQRPASSSDSKRQRRVQKRRVNLDRSRLQPFMLLQHEIQKKEALRREKLQQDGPYEQPMPVQHRRVEGSVDYQLDKRHTRSHRRSDGNRVGKFS